MTSNNEVQFLPLADDARVILDAKSELKITQKQDIFLIRFFSASHPMKKAALWAGLYPIAILLHAEKSRSFKKICSYTLLEYQASQYAEGRC